VISVLEELSAAIKKERPVNALLTELADFLNNKRVLYQHFIREERNPLLPVLLSAEQVREYLIKKVMPRFDMDETGNHVRQMLETCRNFIERLEELPLAVRQNASKPIMDLERRQIDLIEDALYFFRDEFTAPLFWLLTAHGVNIPINILQVTNLGSLHVPDQIYYDGLPIDAKKDIYFAGDHQTGSYLRIATLSQNTVLGNIEWPAGTELIFFDPLPTKTHNRVISAITPVPVTIEGKLHPANEKIYFQLDGQLSDQFPDEESRYDYIDKMRANRKK
jgi:hypothetical protein